MMKKISIITLVVTLLLFLVGLMYQIEYLKAYGVTASGGLPAYDKLAMSGFIFVVYFLFTKGTSIYGSVIAFSFATVIFQKLYSYLLKDKTNKIMLAIKKWCDQMALSIRLFKVFLILLSPCVILLIGVVVKTRIEETVTIEKSGVNGYDTIKLKNKDDVIELKGCYVSRHGSNIIFWDSKSKTTVTYPSTRLVSLLHAKKTDKKEQSKKLTQYNRLLQRAAEDKAKVKKAGREAE